MKQNILAENMKRFATKNLSESDLKRIEEQSLITEALNGNLATADAAGLKKIAAKAATIAKMVEDGKFTKKRHFVTSVAIYQFMGLSGAGVGDKAMNVNIFTLNTNKSGLPIPTFVGSGYYQVYNQANNKAGSMIGIEDVNVGSKNMEGDIDSYNNTGIPNKRMEYYTKILDPGHKAFLKKRAQSNLEKIKKELATKNQGKSVLNNIINK